MGMVCEVVYGTNAVESCIGRRCDVVYGTGGVESCMRVGYEVVYGTDGVESWMGWGARLCMEQVMSNHVWGEMRGRAWNRWCGIV